VHTRHTDVLDIGTSFNVKAYAPDKTVEATLLEGAIEVKSNRGGKKILLTRPNQKCTVFPGPDAASPAGPAGSAGSPPDGGVLSNSAKGTGDRYQVSTVRPDPADSLLAETAWLHDALIFRNESFGTLSIRMGRRYMVSIRFASPEQASYRFTGVVTNETLEQALQELQLIRPFHYTKSKSIITITR
jgi:ferric-dicitrate binding protein FerR (iron transport regulator)